jgi:hypothetical protein
MMPLHTHVILATSMRRKHTVEYTGMASTWDNKCAQRRKLGLSTIDPVFEFLSAGSAVKFGAG